MLEAEAFEGVWWLDLPRQSQAPLLDDPAPRRIYVGPASKGNGYWKEVYILTVPLYQHVEDVSRTSETFLVGLRA